MPGIRLLDVRAALAALGLAALAALAVAVVTHLPAPALSGPATHASSTGLSRLQSLPLQAQSVISSTIAADSRAFTARRTASGWGLSGGGVRADFRAGEPSLSLAGGNTLSLSLTGAPVSAVSGHGNRVTLTRPGIREWYAAGPLGIEQGFTLAHRPAGATAQGVTLSLAVGGSLRARAAGSDVNFVGSRGDIAARYGGLAAVDADRSPLCPSALSVQHGRVLISVNDRGARYPITIDPLVQQGGEAGPERLTPMAVRAASSATSVALSRDGNTALIGAQIDNSSTGAAWVFTRSAGVWSQLGPKLRPHRRTTVEFGTSVALSADGTTALIGGELDDSQTGAAWVFVRVWIDLHRADEAHRQRGPVGSSIRFGHSVALSADGNTALIGGPDDQGAAAWAIPAAPRGSSRARGRPGARVQRSRRPPVRRLTPATSARRWRSRPTAPSHSSAAPETAPGTGAGLGVHRRRLQLDRQQRDLPQRRGLADVRASAARSPSRRDGNTARHRRSDDNDGTGGAAWVFTALRGRPGAEQGRSSGPSNATGPNADFGSSVALSGDGNTVADRRSRTTRT